MPIGSRSAVVPTMLETVEAVGGRPADEMMPAGQVSARGQSGAPSRRNAVDVPCVGSRRR
ncbi:MAG: hypothetical protein D6738_08040 [Acidobacteria bacterium]|nr:MAG: hypothetical protein D6738_08040 [Acidobacteriota bacterium]